MNASRTEISNQIERLALAGFITPKTDKLGAMVEEWCKALARFEVGQIQAAMDWLIQHRTERWWPTLGEVLDTVRLTTKTVEEPSSKCQTCDGSHWIETVPFQSFGHVYTAVRRCPDCGVPSPDYKVPPGLRQSLTAAQHRSYLNRRKTAPMMTQEQFLTRLRELGAERLAQKLVPR